MTQRKTDDDVASLQAQLRRIDDFVAKGLMRAEEAEEARRSLRKRLLEAVVPDAPAPRLPWRVRFWAVLAMAALVAALGAYLLSGQAGLRRQSLEAIDAAKAARARREAAQSEAFARLRAEKAQAAGMASEASTPRPAQGPATVAPLLAGRVELSPSLRARARPADAVFVLVRLPDDPQGLPLAALRRTVADLPFDFTIREAELVGDERRFLQASQVVVTARVSKSGGGHPEPGDLDGAAAPVAPWSRGVVVRIDHALP